MDLDHPLALAVALCVAVTLGAITCAAVALHRAVRPLLAEVFSGNPALAAAVNRFMVLALCIYNLGYSANTLRYVHYWFANERPYPLIEVVDDTLRMIGDNVIAVGASAFAAFFVAVLMRRRVEVRAP